ncbi:MAG: response regulator, partial [Candidatus Hinthialibacter sp.]
MTFSSWSHSSSEPWSFSKDQDLFKQARLLIVDDDPAICDLLKEFLNHLGAHCDAAGHASQAADFIQRNQYDAILSDIYMPEGVRGLDLLHFSTEHSPLTPFILMTGHPTLDNAVEAIRMGAYDFLTKPFNLDYVELMLSRALHYRRLELENQNYQAGLERKVEERTREVHDFLLNS